MHLSISNGFVSSKIYDKRDDFDFDIVHFPFLDGNVPRSTSYGVHISQLIRFARVSSHVADFNARNKSLTAKLLQQGIGIINFKRLYTDTLLEKFGSQTFITSRVVALKVSPYIHLMLLLFQSSGVVCNHFSIFLSLDTFSIQY